MSMGFSSSAFYDDAGNPWSESSENSNESSRSSSTQSWVDDTELSLTQELKEQYEKFEEALYSERSPSELPKSLQAEIKIWSEHSPHIRVRGVKATLHERPDDLPEETFDSNYEEVIESHGSLEESLEKSLSFNDDVKQFIDNCPANEQEVIKTDLKNAIVHKLFDHAMPKVLEKFEPVIKSVSAGKRKSIMASINKSESYLSSLKNQQNQRLTARSNSSRSYMKDMAVRKPPPVDNSCEYQSALSSCGLRRRECDLIPERDVLSVNTKNYSSNLEVPKVKISRASSLSTTRSNNISKTNKGKKLKTVKTEKTTLLPAIEALPITPKTPDKRSVSAMVRFTKTLPRVGPNTARNRKEVSSLTKSTDFFEDTNEDSKSIFQREKVKSSFAPELQVVGTRSATSIKSNRWRY